MQVLHKTDYEIDVALAGERERLVRLCARLTGNPGAAEDLAQETMLEAWRHIERLDRPDGLAQWLSAIARNVCLRWARGHGRELAHHNPGEQSELLESLPHDDSDIAIELERSELAELLDRAMALLPDDTRQVLISHYLEESPQGEVAARLGLTTGAVAKRVERGKLMLRRLLSTDLQEEAAAYGLVSTDDVAWRETTVWCTDCGTRHLWAQFDTAAGALELRCRHCHAAPDITYNSSVLPSIFGGVKSIRPALSRLKSWAASYYRDGLTSGRAMCLHCGAQAYASAGVLKDAVRGFDGHLGVRVSCASCGQCDSYQTVEGMALCLPQAISFWREHPRLLLMKSQELERDGRLASLVSMVSLTDSARLDVLHDQETLRLISVQGGQP